MHPGMALQPGTHREVLVGGAVVDHHMQLAPGLCPGDLTRTSREVLMKVPLMAGDGRVAGEDSVTGEFPNALNLTDPGGPSPPVSEPPREGGPPRVEAKSGMVWSTCPDGK